MQALAYSKSFEQSRFTGSTEDSTNQRSEIGYAERSPFHRIDQLIQYRIAAARVESTRPLMKAETPSCWLHTNQPDKLLVTVRESPGY